MWLQPYKGLPGHCRAESFYHSLRVERLPGTSVCEAARRKVVADALGLDEVRDICDMRISCWSAIRATCRQLAASLPSDADLLSAWRHMDTASTRMRVNLGSDLPRSQASHLIL